MEQYLCHIKVLCQVSKAKLIEKQTLLLQSEQPAIKNRIMCLDLK